MNHAVYGLIGRKLGHSFSAGYFNDKFGVEHIDAEYRLMPVPEISGLPVLVASIPDLRGLNVTIPYKEKIIPYLNSLSPLAKAIGAVNVVKINRLPDGSVVLYGDNSDALGFRDSLLPLLPPGAAKALVLGTGGAAKAVAYVLQSLGFEVILVSRNPGLSASRSCERASVSVLPYSSLTPQSISGCEVIVNATPLGMHPDIATAPEIPYEGIRPGTLCYDLVYNPEVTEFMRRSAVRGAVVKNGLEMLHRQAERAWEIWNA